MKGTPFLFALLLMSSAQALAWGHNGHEIVASLAGRVLVEKENMKYLMNNEYSLGFYANAPDMIWKNMGEETYKTEHPLHYFDWYDKYVKIFKTPQNLPEDFNEFKKQMGSEFKVMDGESPWRIKQLFEKCLALSKDLNFEKQGSLIECVGLMSHYIGDLSQPLHVTNNFDGQLTGQKGIHAYFEDEIINILDPEIRPAVLKAALKIYDTESKKKKSYGMRVRDLIAESYAQVDKLLKLDKKYGRAMTRKNAENYKALAIDCLARGVATTALVWKEIFSNVTNFDNHKFYYFNGKPEYVQPTFMQPEVMEKSK